jgi:hypothetical protein
MKVRLTSDNIHDNKNFKLFDGGNPVNWFVSSGGSKLGESTWNIENTNQLYPARVLKFQGNPNNIENYVTVVKSATVRAYSGGGTYYNVSGIPRVLTELNRTYEDISNPSDLSILGLGRSFVADTPTSVLGIRNVSSFLTMETEMLRLPQFTDNVQIEPLIVQEKNSKRLEVATSYNPLISTLSFLNCLEENLAIKSFFQTLSYYGVGFSVEVWQLQSEASNWGGFQWSTPKWGGIAAGYGYGKKYYFDIANNNFEQASVTGKLDINVIYQKTEAGFGDNQ